MTRLLRVAVASGAAWSPQHDFRDAVRAGKDLARTRFVSEVVSPATSLDLLFPCVEALSGRIFHPDGEGQGGDRCSFKRPDSDDVIVDRSLHARRDITPRNSSQPGDEQADRVVRTARPLSGDDDCRWIVVRLVEANLLLVCIQNKMAESHVALWFGVQFHGMTRHAVLARHPSGRVASGLQAFGMIGFESEQVVVGQFTTGGQRCGLGGGGQFQIGGFQPEPIKNQRDAAHHDDQRHGDHRRGKAASSMGSQ